jgi:hypothetical protein
MHGTRDIGRVGTLARLGGGVILIVVPIAGHGISPWDAAGALIALPLVAFLVAAALGPRQAEAAAAAATRRQALLAIAIVLVLATALTFLTPVDQGAIWLFLGVSTLLAGLRGYAGCELLAIPNALSGRRDRLDCFIYSPIDGAERRRVPSAGSWRA